MMRLLGIPGALPIFSVYQTLPALGYLCHLHWVGLLTLPNPVNAHAAARRRALQMCVLQQRRGTLALHGWRRALQMCAGTNNYSAHGHEQ